MSNSTVVIDTNPDDDDRLGKGPGQSLTADELRTYPPFAHIDRKLLAQQFSGAAWSRQYKSGEYVCRQGEFGKTAFYIVSGKVRVVLPTAEGAPKAKVKAGGSWLGNLLWRGRVKRKPKEPAFIPVDASQDADPVTRSVVLTKGDFVGEMACLRRLPRAADVIAEEDTVCLEILPNLFAKIAEHPQQRKWREEKAQFLRENPDKRFEKPRPPDTAIQILQRQRAKVELRQCEILKSIPDDVVDAISERVDLVDFVPGEVLCRQGDPSNEFYLIRRGFVKVAVRHPGATEDLVINYMSRGGYFGEIGLLRNEPRSATCTAVGNVEVIALSKADFDELVAKFPEFRKQLEQTEAARLEAAHQRAPIRAGFDFKEFTDQELMQGQDLLLFDLDRCTRCDECVRACADSHDGITRLRREGLRFDKYFVPTSCRSCRDPVCLTFCPVGSIGRSTTGAIIIEDWCIGCRMCEENCPYGNIRMHQVGVKPGEHIYPKQKISRRRKVRFRAPPELDLSALPFGMEYDATDGWLSFADVTKAAGEEQVKKFSAHPAYQAAVKKLLAAGVTVVSLPVLPTLAEGRRGVNDLIETKLGSPATISFFGVVDGHNEEDYKKLSGDPAYRDAVERAKTQSHGMIEVMSKAVVCDLCESLDGTPRCVHACPHDAAFRIDAKEFFQKEGKTR
jgi:CRP-like cAMP-binding protein/Fe-S-cluster-containing hydrogenase component 2